MQYSFKCPMDEFTATVEAGNDDEAVGKILEAAGGHAASAHPDMVSMPAEQVKEMVRANMKKG